MKPYRHFKHGHIYNLLGFAWNPENNEHYVVYVRGDADKTPYPHYVIHHETETIYGIVNGELIETDVLPDPSEKHKVTRWIREIESFFGWVNDPQDPVVRVRRFAPVQIGPISICGDDNEYFRRHPEELIALATATLKMFGSET